MTTLVIPSQQEEGRRVIYLQSPKIQNTLFVHPSFESIIINIRMRKEEKEEERKQRYQSGNSGGNGKRETDNRLATLSSDRWKSKKEKEQEKQHEETTTSK